MALGQYLAVLTLLAQDEVGELFKKIEEARKDLKGMTADVRIESTGKYEDSSTSSSGRLTWKPGAALLEEKDLRTLVAGAEATVLQVKKKRAHVYDLARTFHPLALLDLRREEWEIAIALRPEQSKLPDELHVKGGEKPKAPDVKLPGRPRSNGMGDIEAEEGKYVVLELKSKVEAIREFVASVKLFLHKDTLQVEKIIVDDAMNYSVYRLTGWKPLPEVDEKVFQLNLDGVKVTRP
jgi:hypothetical protein